MTVLEAIQRSSDYLARKGVDAPRLQAELLLADLVKLPRMQLYLRFERVLQAGEVDALRELVKRRGHREPLQHILGSTSFCGLEMAVNPHVLVPRPETELLAEAGWKFLLEASARQPVARGLDFGTGSGCIAIALAINSPRSEVYAVDVSPEALETANRNAARHGVTDRIRLLQSDGFTSLPGDLKFDLIISNPPYIPTDEINTLQPEVRDHDPRGALDGGVDGLDFYRMLAATAPARLLAGGKLMVEFGDGQESALGSLFQAQNWIVEDIRPDYTGTLRILVARPG